MVPEIETARLILKPLTSLDADRFQKIFPQWEIVRYMIGTIPWPYPENAARDFIENRALPSVQNGKAWYWTIRRKEDENKMIGLIYLKDSTHNNRGFWLVPEWQRCGYMTEASIAVTDFWFGTLGRSLLRTPKASANYGSVKISIKNGMRRIRTERTVFISGELDSELWEITRDEWFRHSGSYAGSSYKTK